MSEENEIEDGIFYAHLDEVLNEKWSKEVIIDIKQNLADIAPAIREAEVYVYVLEDRYAEGASWDPSKKMDKPMNIHLTLDGEGLSKKETVAMTKSIQKMSNERGYDYKDFALNYYIPYEGDWIVRYTTIFSPNHTIKENDFEVHNEFLFE